MIGLPAAASATAVHMVSVSARAVDTHNTEASKARAEAFCNWFFLFRLFLHCRIRSRLS